MRRLSFALLATTRSAMCAVRGLTSTPAQTDPSTKRPDAPSDGSGGAAAALQKGASLGATTAESLPAATAQRSADFFRFRPLHPLIARKGIPDMLRSQPFADPVRIIGPRYER